MNRAMLWNAFLRDLKTTKWSNVRVCSDFGMIIFLYTVQKINYVTTTLRHERSLNDVISCVKEHKNYPSIKPIEERMAQLVRG